MLERGIEAYLVKRVRELGGEVRKVRWEGRRSAPDRRVMLPGHVRETRRNRALWSQGNPWVEVKNPETILTFPADARERAQAREHKRMRDCGELVLVIGTKEQVDELLG